MTFETSTTNSALFATQPQVSATGDLTFTLAAVAGVATVSVVLRDGGGVAAGGEDSSTAQTFTVTIADVAPVLSFSRGQWIDAPMAEELIFDVEAVDFNGDVLDLRLLNPPPGCVFDPLPLSAGPLRARLRWRVPKETPGLRQLYFQSRSGTHTTTSAVTIQAASFLGLTSSNYLTGDVTGDGVLDLVGVGSYVDAATSTDVGAIYVWAGSSTPQGNPTATLRHSAPQNGDRLGHAGSMQGLFLVDLTGDGVLDVVAGGSLVDAPGPVSDAGAVFVWAGGSTLSGSPTPLATLRRPTPVAFDQLGDVHGGQGILFGDVTGDGRLDLIVGSDSLDAPGPIRDVGGALVWAGGNGLVGSPSPYAELYHPSPTTEDRLTYGGVSQSLVLGDVTGDGILDVLLGGRRLDLGGAFDSGGGFLWAGGPALAGRPSPTATLRRVTPRSGDELGSVGGAMFTLGDVTHDGVLDVLIGGSSVSAGTNDSGAIYLWAGGAALTGTPPPRATLQNPELDSFGYLGNVRTSGALIIADLTGDERLDILVAGSRLDAPGSGAPSHVGGAFLWSGGAGLSGTPAPTAALRHPNPRFGDELGFAAGGGGTQVADLTGDGVLDVILVGSDVSTASVSKAGAGFLWAGGPTLTGSPAPTASFWRPTPADGDRLGSGTDGVRVRDVTGDGYCDLILTSSGLNVSGNTSAGGSLVWAGGPSLAGTPAPTATLIRPTPFGSDFLGVHVAFADLSGDGVLDVVLGSPYADEPSASNTGLFIVWRGGASLAGTPAPLATLAHPGAVAEDRLGLLNPSGPGLAFGDLDGDGVLDLVAAGNQVDVAGVADAGAAFFWRGGPTLAGAPPPTSTFRAPSLTSGDQLFLAERSMGLLLLDLTGDGTLDLLAAGSELDVSASDSGGALLWIGGVPFRTRPQVTFSDPAARVRDQLGRTR